MKKTYIIFLLLILSFSLLIAQTNGTWGLTTNGNCTATGYVSGSALAGGGGIGTISYGTNGAYSGNWNSNSLAVAQTGNDYYQYTLTATANISITTISTYVMYSGNAAMTAAVLYSINGGAYTQAGSNLSVTTTSTQQTISGLNFSILSGQTFTLRIYAWSSNSSGKTFYNKTSVITGYWSAAGDYFRTYASGNWSNINDWMSSPNNTTWYHASLYPTNSAASVDIINGNVITLTAAATANNLNFTSGSITLGNNNLTINGTLTGTPYFTYSGTGVPSQTGTVSHVTVTTTAPTSLPAVLNTLTINPGTGNNVVLPNDVTTTNLGFTSGGLSLNGNDLTLAGKDFSLTSSDAVLTALTVSTANSSNTWGGSVSIARTWTTSAEFTNQVDMSLTYPESETAAATVKVWRRVTGDTGPWALVGTYNTVDNGTTRTVTVTGADNLNFPGGSWDWTVSDISQTLPVELSSFTGVLTAQSYVMLEWVTQSETGVVGYYLFRGVSNELATAERINAFITATNTSQETSYAFMDREASPGSTYFYWLQNIEFTGDFDFHGPITVQVVGNNTPAPIIPLETGLQPCYPNPFNESTNVSYGLSKDSSVSLVILNSKGAVVRNLFSGNKKAGTYRLNWDGRNDNGTAVTSGIYFVRLTSGSHSSVRKLVMMN